YSLRAFEAMEYAADQGRAVRFRRAVFDLLWVEGKDIGRISTVQDAAERAGLEPEDMARAIHDRDYIERTAEAVASARDVGMTATPTMILGRTRIVGWHYYEALQ